MQEAEKQGGNKYFLYYLILCIKAIRGFEPLAKATSDEDVASERENKRASTKKRKMKRRKMKKRKQEKKDEEKEA